jgi:ribosomal protein S12 methylthiotransferase
VETSLRQVGWIAAMALGLNLSRLGVPLSALFGYAALAGEVSAVVVAGCLVQLHATALAEEIPEVDAFVPLSDYSGVPSIVDSVLGHSPSDVCPTGESRVFAGGEVKAAGNDLGRGLLTPVHTAYLRLGEGCNHVCAFCAIPKIRGKLKSKPIEVLLEEAEALASLGARELTLIAEDSTDYGKDLRAGYGLTDLLTGLGGVSGIEWVRVMYAHPATIDEPLVATMAKVGNVLPYLDMPVQHGDEGVLRAMRRGTTPDRIHQVVGWLREAIPDITLRTTILTGFPGETDEAFGHLMELLEELRFDRVGCFTWSPEETTEGFGLPGRVDPAVAEERRAKVMRFQRELMEAAHRARIGTHERVLVDAVGEDGALGRTRRDAPEVDGRVLIGSADGALAPGDFVDVKITGVKGYDLVGTLTS